MKYCTETYNISKTTSHCINRKLCPPYEGPFYPVAHLVLCTWFLRHRLGIQAGKNAVCAPSHCPNHNRMGEGVSEKGEEEDEPLRHLSRIEPASNQREMSSISSGKGREEKREAQEIGRACERGQR